MIKIQNSEAMTPDGSCSLAIAAIGILLSTSGESFVIKTATPLGFTGTLFETTQSRIDEISSVLGDDWSVSLGESDLVTCTKV